MKELKEKAAARRAIGLAYAAAEAAYTAALATEDAVARRAEDARAAYRAAQAAYAAAAETRSQRGSTAAAAREKARNAGLLPPGAKKGESRAKVNF